MDSGCSFHMTHVKEAFKDSKMVYMGSVKLGDDRPCQILGYGTVTMKTESWITFDLKDVRSFVIKSMNFSKTVRSGMLSGSDDVTLFSSSLPVLPHEKLTLNNTGNDYQQSVETNSLLEDHAIGSLLPNEDDLLAGVLNGFDYNLTNNVVDESEDFDLFGSGGRMEMEYDMMDNLNFGMSKVSWGDGVVFNCGAQYNISNGVGPVTVEHPYGEHPSRTLFVRNINSNVEDLELRALFEQYGDIRTLYTACKHRGFVMISYYDIRDARTAMRALQNKPLRRRKLDIHYSIPKENPSDKDINQGTLVVFNLDPSVSCDDLLQIFGAYGKVREIRETPYKRHHKFIEYYDVRDAEAALRSLNRCDIAGRRIKLEPSRPGGYSRNQMLQLSHEFDQDDSRSFRLQANSLTNSPVFASLSPNGLPGLVSILHTQPAIIAPIGKDHIRTSYLDQTFSNGNSIQDHNLSHVNRSMPAYGASASTTSGIETLSGTEFLWGSPTKPSHGFPTTAQSPTTTTVHPLTGQLGPGPFLSSSQLHHNVGSAPSGLPFDRHFSQNHEPPEKLFMSPPTFVGIGLVPWGSVNIMENGSPGFSNVSPRMTGHMFLGSEHYLGPGSIDLDIMSERAENCWVGHNANQMDNKKQFQLDLDKISNGEDNRTTLMIKSIPNKYTSKMLLAAINENHIGTYDFLYLPINFKNKCNVGYAFINMLSPMHIIPFYQVFNGKKWEKFNSGKVASLAYARIQGKAALITHFQNSSLIYEDKRCWPLLFQSEGSDAVDQEYLPSSSLNRQDHPYSGDPLASPSPPDDGNC